MSSGLVGACECGKISYRIANDKVDVYVCHCLKCQTRSGSAFAEHSMVAASSVSIQGETVSRSHRSNDTVFEDIYCANCMTQIYNRNSMFPDMLFLRAGTLSQSETLAPFAHIWTKRKQPWITIPDDVASFPESPTPDQFFAVIPKPGR